METHDLAYGPCKAAPHCPAMGRFPAAYRGLCPDCWNESNKDYGHYLDHLAEERASGGAGSPQEGIEGPRTGEFADFWAPLNAGSMPPADAPWGEIARFALTFDGYAVLPIHQLGDLANGSRDEWDRSGRLPAALVDLRCCLFFEQRRYHHFGTPPEPQDERYLRALLEAIRLHAEGLPSVGGTT